MNKTLLNFLQDLTILLESKITLLEAVRLVNSPLKDRIYFKLSCGEKFSSILGAAGVAEEQLSMIRNSEICGQLEHGLKLLVSSLEEKIMFRNSLIEKMVYPLLVIILAAASLIFFELLILPVYSNIFREMQLATPLLIRLIPYWKYLILVSILLILFTSRIVAKKFFLFQDLDKISFLEDLSLAFSSGVQLTEFFAVRPKWRHLVYYFKKGASLSYVLSRTAIFDKRELELIRIAEKSDQVPRMIAQLSRQNRLQLNSKINRFTNILEPAMIIFCGVFIGFICFSLFKPILSVTSSLAY